MGRKGLVLRVDGEVVSKFDERVESVQVMGARGEIGRVGIAEADEVIDIVINRAGNLNKHLLDVEEEARQLQREETLDREEADGPEGGGQLQNIGLKPDDDVNVQGPTPLAVEKEGPKTETKSGPDVTPKKKDK